MSHYLNPDKMTTAEQQRIAAWLESNGCRHYVALEPVLIRGNYAEYTAVCRKDKRSLNRVPIDRRTEEFVLLGRRRVRIRHPLKAA